MLAPEAPEQVRRALARFAPQAAEVRVTATPHVRFIDPGANLERIGCPSCGAGVDRAWWRWAAMGRAWRAPAGVGAEPGSGARALTMPCCGAGTSLHNLEYHWPAGFARFTLDARDPEVRDLTGAQVAAPARLLGCRAPRIWAHL